MAKGDNTLTWVAGGTQDRKPEVRVAIVDLALTGNYISGGYAITGSGFTKILGCSVLENTAGYVALYKDSTSKVLLYQSKDPGNAGGADIVLQEVVDNAAITPTVRLAVFGLVI